MTFPLDLTDATGRSVVLPAPPQRIVSLVPSQTELLADLGLDARVVGLTRFCIHPSGWKARKTIVGGTKQVNLDRIRALRPDLILANREENTRVMVEALGEIAPVYVTDVRTLDDALAMIRTVGRLTGRARAAEALAEDIRTRFAGLPSVAPLRTAYLIWHDPLMTVGHDTFIHDLLARGGFANVFGERTRYPALTRADLAAARPAVVLLPDEPYPFDEADRRALAAALPDATVRLVDGAPFSWYGSRLRHTPAYLSALRASLTTATRDA